jgi:SAM-dependent methyltransferase
VLDLAAGTGKLTRQLAALGARVVAVEPLDEMRAHLESAVPGVRALAGRAEAIPLEERSVDAVTVAQAFHWFDAPLALVEIHRVLRPAGALALVWNGRDPGDELQAAVDAEIRPHRRRAGLDRVLDPQGELERSGLFARPDERRFPHVQAIARERYVDRVASTSVVAALPDRERAALLERVRALAAEMPEPLELSYVTEVYVADRL